MPHEWLGRWFTLIAIFRPNLADSPFLKLPSLLELPKPVSMCRRDVLMLSYRRQEPWVPSWRYEVDPLAQPGTITLYKRIGVYIVGAML